MCFLNAMFLSLLSRLRAKTREVRFSETGDFGRMGLGPDSDNAVGEAPCLELSLKSCMALPRMCPGHNVKIAIGTDLPELEVGHLEEDT